MGARSMWVAAWVAVGLVGCGASDAGSPGEPASTRAYLLMDPSMRAEGGELEIGSAEAPTRALLPVDVSSGEAVSLRSRAGKSNVAPERGRLAWVHGPDAFVEWLTVGTDVTADALLVESDEAGAKELADTLSAELRERGGDTWELRAQDLWERTAFLEAPGGVREARPILRSIASVPVEPDGPARVFAGLPAVGGSAGAALVGVYSSEHGALVLDAAGGFELQRWDGVGNGPGCRLPVPPEHGQYEYREGVVTLRSSNGLVRYTPSGTGLRGSDGTVFGALETEDAP